MENQWQDMIEVQFNEFIKLLQNRRVVRWNTWNLENKFSRIMIKR